jgi:hypothetical protein
MQDKNLFGRVVHIQANSDALFAVAGLLATNIANTGTNSAIITGIVLSLGIPSTHVTLGTGIYGSIESKTNRSLFGSGNIGIWNWTIGIY